MIFLGIAEWISVDKDFRIAQSRESGRHVAYTTDAGIVQPVFL